MTPTCEYIELACELFEDPDGCDEAPVARQRWADVWHYLCERHSCQPIPDELLAKTQPCGKPATHVTLDDEAACYEHRVEYGFD